MSSFIESLAPPDFRVLDVKLKRLTFGHVVLLERFECNPPNNLFDLATAVQLCSRSYSEAIEYVDSLNTLRSRVTNWWFIRRLRKTDAGEAARAWDDYITENSKAPEFSISSNPQESRAGAPTLAQIRVYLLRSCNYSPDTILDQPYGQCLWDFGASREQDLGEGIVGDKHREIQEMLLDAKS